MTKLWRSGLILSSAGLIGGIGNYAFQIIIGRCLTKDEYGNVNGTLAFVGLLSLPLPIATMAITHYIARFNATGEGARLRGLLAGCRRLLLRLTIAGSVLAAMLIKPLGDFFHLPRTSLTLVALVCVLAGLWGSYVTALCQGLSWFKRLALIGILGVLLRLTFGGLMTLKFPIAEIAVTASGVAILANLVLLVWRKDLSIQGEAISPWNRDFVQFVIVSAACVGGGYFFTQGDLLVAKRYFSGGELGAYSSAGVLARALPMVVAPLLTVLFTHRSGQHTGSSFREQLKLLALYAIGLAVGAIGLMVLRGFLVGLIFGRPAPDAAAMIARLALTMAFVGLLQALALWALASRWLKLAFLYGVLGLVYWMTLLRLGKSPAELLQVMPLSAGIALGALFLAWILTIRANSTRDSVRSK